MAIRGRKPNLGRRVTGSHLRDRPLPQLREPGPPGPVERPSGLKGDAARIWDQTIARCDWLTWADSCKAEMYCHLMAEYRAAPTKMIASRIAQLRGLWRDLRLDGVP